MAAGDKEIEIVVLVLQYNGLSLSVVSSAFDSQNHSEPHDSQS